MLAPLLLVVLALPTPRLELVYSTPVETTLLQPSLRSPSEVWPAMFDAATQSIDLAEFYLATKPGEPLEPILEHLRQAGARGVKIRVLVEQKMEKNGRAEIARVRGFPSTELRVVDYSRISEQGIHHAKYLVIDRQSAYLGSQNFDWRSLKHIHELGVRIAEPALARQLASIFEEDWKLSGQLDRNEPLDPPATRRPLAPDQAEESYLVASPWPRNPTGVPDSETELVRLIGEAKHNLRAQLLEYCPLDYPKKQLYPPIDLALRTAVARGVKLELLVSSWNAEAPCFQHLLSLAVLPGVAVKMVKLPEAKEGPIPFARVIHSKYLLIDDQRLWLGTSNWSGGYLDHSRNVELVTRQPALVARASAIHRQLFESSYASSVDCDPACRRASRPTK